MFNSAILDLIILLAFTYFIGSLLLSTINESITQGLFKQRQSFLKDALENLFFETAWKPFIQDTFIKSPHLQSLMRNDGKYPAYIPSNNFVLAIIQIIGSANYTSAKLQNAIAINGTLPSQFKQVLQDIAARADNKLEDFEKGLSQFYNDAMDRSGGWYKRRVRMILLVLGFMLSAALNLDTIKISNDALRNKRQLQETVDKIVEQLPNINISKDSQTIDVTIKDPKGNTLVTQKSTLDTKIDTTTKAKNTKASIESFHTIQVFYENTSFIGLGYADWADVKIQWFGGFAKFLFKLLGVLITTFALQLGSNYWFDMLNKAVNIRAVGKKPNGEKQKSK